jgi:hypothetical protein
MDKVSIQRDSYSSIVVKHSTNHLKFQGLSPTTEPGTVWESVKNVGIQSQNMKCSEHSLTWLVWMAKIIWKIDKIKLVLGEPAVVV